MGSQPSQPLTSSSSSSKSTLNITAAHLKSMASNANTRRYLSIVDCTGIIAPKLADRFDKLLATHAEELREANNQIGELQHRLDVYLQGCRDRDLEIEKLKGEIAEHRSMRNKEAKAEDEVYELLERFMEMRELVDKQTNERFGGLRMEAREKLRDRDQLTGEMYDDIESQGIDDSFSGGFLRVN